MKQDIKMNFEEKDGMIIHKASQKKIINAQEVSSFYQAENGFLVLKTKNACCNNLVFDACGEKLPHTGKENIEVFLYNHSYGIRTVSDSDTLSAKSNNDIEKSLSYYPYPNYEFGRCVIQFDAEEDMYRICHKKTGRILDEGKEFKVFYKKDYTPYFAIKSQKNSLWYVYDENARLEPELQNVSKIELDEDDFFRIGLKKDVALTRSERFSQNMDKLNKWCPVIFTLCALAGFYVWSNKEPAVEKPISEMNAAYIGMNQNKLYFDIDGNLRTAELVGVIDERLDLKSINLDMQRYIREKRCVREWKNIHIDLNKMNIEKIR